MIKKPANSKTHQICAVMKNSPIPLTRVEILYIVHRDGHSTIPFKGTSNHCYFTRYGRGNGGKYSLVTRGLIRIVGRSAHVWETRGRLLYALTPKGCRYARAFNDWLNAQ